MKLNCDLGESFGSWTMGLDEEVMPHINMANIACGFHAGDPNVMFKTLHLAKKFNVEVGAHPGYQDINGFGRRSIKHSKQELVNLIVYQVSALAGMAKTVGMTVSYVKPHGALYNDMMASSDILAAVIEAMKLLNGNTDKKLKLMMLATANWQQHQQMASESDVELLFEAFADRKYTDSGHLLSRGREGAVLNQEQMLKQVSNIVKHGKVETASGKELSIKADTICVHGDNQAGIDKIKQIRAICQQ